VNPVAEVKPSQLLTFAQKRADRIVSELLSAKPLETRIFVETPQTDAMRLAEDIKAIFIKGGFGDTQVVQDSSGLRWPFVKGWITTNGIQNATDEIPEVKLAEALNELSRATGSKEGIISGHGTPAQLAIFVREQ
jgi:hypothetical protein